jgi:small-conductance mechanosensitive channel
MNEFLLSVKGFLDLELFRIGETMISISTLFSVLIILSVTFVVSRILRRLVMRGLARGGAKQVGTGSLAGIIHYVVLVTGVGIAMNVAGIDLGALFAAGAILAVAVAFAVQSVAQNFVAGMVLLTERSIKPGDLLEVEGRVVRVLEIGIRASFVRTRDAEDLIVPNSVLTQTTVKNYTLRDSDYRIRIPVGVVYGSDMKNVKEVLFRAARRVSAKWEAHGQEPQVLMQEFGNHSVIWDVSIWIDDPWERRVATSELHEAIWEEFQANGIVIAFPQLDLHLDPPVMAALDELAKRRAA